MGMKVEKGTFPSIEQVAGRLGQASAGQGKAAGAQRPDGMAPGSFGEILRTRQEAGRAGALRFSKHANQRLASRNIDLTAAQLRRLEDGADRARQKGIRDSLVMVDNMAFIVNVPSKTVVTAVSDAEEGVFTNIDGAVIG